MFKSNKIPMFVVSVLANPCNGKNIGVIVGANFLETLKRHNVNVWKCRVISNKTPQRLICQLELGKIVFFILNP